MCLKYNSIGFDRKNFEVHFDTSYPIKYELIINNCQILIVTFFSMEIRDNIEFTAVFKLESLLSTF